jgi:N-acyl amino acid synthase of PEP-CTERM/exosortase system
LSPTNVAGIVGGSGATVVYHLSASVNRLDDYFDVIEADTPELLDEVFSLRYQVYCIENQFEDATQYPDGREMDVYDPRSRHVAMIHRRSGDVVATTRLIIARQLRAAPLPIERVICPEAMFELKRYPASQVAEISRYAISKNLRRRKGETEIADIGWNSAETVDSRRYMPHLTLGLMRGILTLSVAADVRFLCACVKPALRRLLQQFGLEFRPIGSLVEYHGIRQPCIADRDELLSGLRDRDSRFYDIVAEPLIKQAC